MSGEDWTTANQRVLVGEFARLKATITGEDASLAERNLACAREALQDPATIDVLVDAFGLSTFERDVLLLTAGVVMQTELANQCRAINDSVDMPYATFGLALARFDNPHWSALAPSGPLRHWRLVDVQDERVLTTSRISIDERVLHYLAGINYIDARLGPILRVPRKSFLLSSGQDDVVTAVTRALGRQRAQTSVVQLIGGDLPVSLEVARQCAERLGMALYVMKATDIPPNAHEADDLATLWARDAILLRSALFVDCTDAVVNRVADLLDRIGGACFVACSRALTLQQRDLRVAVNKPQGGDQKKIWTNTLGAAAQQMNGGLDALTAQFSLDVSAIEHIALSVVNSLPAEEMGAALWRACREVARSRLNEVAQRVEPLATWNDLVLAEPQLITLKQITTHVRGRTKVYDSWGFGAKSARGLGITALFSGESGTGKTMAAEVLANDLALDLYRIDLASTVSKYIGETEKNLKRIFDAAEDSGAILLFDEADALFGKRSEVKDSHDRYANIEVSYLLQRMEAYRGLAILTTNIKGALDPAFERRIRFCVKFPFPDATHRELIWRGAFPSAAPLDAVDFAKLAKLNVPGGSIRNIALSAAFMAAEAGGPIGMADLLSATRCEASKRDRPFSDAETRGWV